MGISESKVKEKIINSIQNNYSGTRIKNLIKKIPKKTDINSLCDSSGNTLLNIASTHDRKSIVLELIHYRGVNINICNDEGVTPIHQSIINGNEEITSILLKQGANLNTVSELHQTPLITAIQKGETKLIELMLGQSISASNDQVTNGGGSSNKSSLSSLHSSSSDHFPQGSSNNTIGDIDVNLPDKQKMTPLMWAAQQGNDALVSTLLNCGADVNRRDSQSRTAIYIAKSLNHNNIISLLSEYFCKANKISKLLTSIHQHQINNKQTINSNITMILNPNNNNNNNSSSNVQNQNSATLSPQNATDSLASSWSSSDSLPNNQTIQNTNNNFININNNFENINNNGNNSNSINVHYKTTYSDLDSSSIQKHKRENSTLNSTISSSSKDCKICWERPSDTVLLWCGHYAICYYCSQFLSQCPLCIAPIEKVQRVFVS